MKPPPDDFVAAAIRALLERGDRVGAIERYAAYARACASEGRSPDPALVELFRQALMHSDIPAPRELPATPFYGRDEEVRIVLAALEGPAAAIVLHGPGGVGKTRLALRVLELARERFDEVRWCSVEDVLGDPAPRIEAACEGLSFDARALIVIDEAELHAERVRATRRLLSVAAPRWTFLVTTRYAEPADDALLVRIEPFATAPGPDARESPAVGFLMARARAAGVADAEDAVTTEAFARLADRVDGLPLALEVIAAQLRSFSPAEVLRRLDAPGMAGLFAERAVAASALALEKGDRSAFARFGIFPGRWTLADARDALAGDATSLADVPGVLDRLVSWSLVHTERVGAVSAYRYLATTRVVAMRRLEADGDRAALFESVAAATLARAEALGNATLRGSANFDDLEASLATIRAALVWGASTEPAVRAFVAMRRFWADRGHSREALALVEIFGEPANPTIAAQLALTEAACARRVPDNARASSALARALQLAESVGDEELVGAILTALGAAAFERGDFEGSREALGRAVALKAPGSLQWGRALANLAVLHAANADDDAALAVYERIEASCEDAHLALVCAVGRAVCYAGKGDPIGARAWIERARASLGPSPNPVDAMIVAHGETLAATRLDDAPMALAAAETALALGMVNELSAFVTLVTGLVAIVAAAVCDPAAVARVYGFNEAMRRRGRLPLEPALAGLHERANATLRARLGEVAFESACRAGAALRADEIVALVFTLRGAAVVPAHSGGGDRGPATLLRLASGTVVRDGIVVPLAPRERDLVHALLSAERSSRERLVEALWPDRSAADGANALRVTLHRLRAKLGPGPTIERFGDSLRIDPRVSVDLIVVERELRLGGVAERSVFEAFLSDIRAGRSLPASAFAWSEEIERRIDRAARAVALKIGESHLAAGDAASALDHANWLIALDPLDESAIALAVRAWLAAGDATSARRLANDYRGRLREEMGTEPGPAFEALGVDMAAGLSENKRIR